MSATLAPRVAPEEEAPLVASSTERREPTPTRPPTAFTFETELDIVAAATPSVRLAVSLPGSIVPDRTGASAIGRVVGTARSDAAIGTSVAPPLRASKTPWVTFSGLAGRSEALAARAVSRA